MTADLIAFLRARLDDDAAAALAVSADERSWYFTDEVVMAHHEAGYTVYVACGAWDCDVNREFGTHIARHDPARVLREVAFARWLIKEAEVLEEYRRDLSQQAPDSNRLEAATAAAGQAMLAVRARAAVHADHPDFKETWRNA